MGKREGYIASLEERLAEAKEQLEPLERGKLQLGSRSYGGQWEDKTQHWIDHFRKTIAMYVHLIERNKELDERDG